MVSRSEKFKLDKEYSISLIDLTFEQLILADFHVGNKINDFNSLNYHFIYGQRHRSLVINLQFTFFNLRTSLFFLTDVIARRGKVLFIDGSPSHENLVGFFAKTSRQYFCNQKWISGTLTNFKFFYTAVFNNGSSRHFVLSSSSAFGFRYLHRPPNVVCIFNLPGNVPALTEVIRVGIPSISLVNTDFSMAGITFPIFANASSVETSTLFLTLLRSAILNGYRYEFYKFFRESIKSSLHKRISFIKARRILLENFFFILKIRLFLPFFSFFFVVF